MYLPGFYKLVYCHKEKRFWATEGKENPPEFINKLVPPITIRDNIFVNCGPNTDAIGDKGGPQKAHGATGARFWHPRWFSACR